MVSYILTWCFEFVKFFFNHLPFCCIFCKKKKIVSESSPDWTSLLHIVTFFQVKLEQGIEMLKIFKDHEAETSILDDFNFYDEREKALQERKARQQASSSTKKEEDADASIKQLSENLAGALQLEDGGGKEEPRTK